jgi:hypothetical protein
MENNGIPIIREFPFIRSGARIHNADLDVKATYPTIEACANISKETTLRELSRIDGISEREQRIIGLNLTGGVSNAAEVCTMVYKMPTFTQWGDLMDMEIEAGRF